MAVVGSAIATVQAALYTKLTGDSTLIGMLASGGVRDMANVPETQPFPYVTLGDVHEMQKDTFTGRQYDLAATLHIWTRNTNTVKSFRPAQLILARMNVLLHKKALTISGQRHVGTWYQDVVELLDPDGLSQHLAALYRIVVEEDDT